MQNEEQLATLRAELTLKIEAERRERKEQALGVMPTRPEARQKRADGDTEGGNSLTWRPR